MTIIIVGAGPGGLFSALKLLERGLNVSLYDQMPSVGRKFLIAGKGGLNLTHSEDLNQFIEKYGKESSRFKKFIEAFTPDDLCNFCCDLGVDTFVGSSGRIFPKKMNSADLLIKWFKKLKSFKKFKFFPNHKLIEILPERTLKFECRGKEVSISGDKIIFALGGGSWKKTGSDGLWSTVIAKMGVLVHEFSSMNSGITAEWSSYFISKIDHKPLKNISLTINERTVKGELMLTPYGIEGGIVYALGREIKSEIEKNVEAKVTIDLLPQFTEEEVLSKLSKSQRKDSLSNHLRKSLKIFGPKFILFKELTTLEEMKNYETLSHSLKNIKLIVNGLRPLDEAISTSGGVSFDEVDENLMLKKWPHFYIVGEMLDWDAPTGGYLLQGCFSTAFWATQAIIEEK